MTKNLDLNVFGTKRDVAPKQKPDRFPSTGDHIQVTPTFEHAWVTKEVLKNRGSVIDF